MGDNIAYSKLLNEKIVQTNVDRTALWPPEGEHEIALAYHVTERRAVKCKVPLGITDPRDQARYKDNWKAAMGPEWVTGTADYAMELLDEPWVDDLKTGRRASYDDYLHQQGFYCMAWALVKYGELREARSTLTHWPKYPKSRAPERIGRTYTIDYYKALQSELLNLKRTVDINQLPTGGHCHFCPSKLDCPSYAARETRTEEEDVYD